MADADAVERAVTNTWRAASRIAETESWSVQGSSRADLLKLSLMFRRIAERKDEAPTGGSRG